MYSNRSFVFKFSVGCQANFDFSVFVDFTLSGICTVSLDPLHRLSVGIDKSRKCSQMLKKAWSMKVLLDHWHRWG